MTLLLNVVEISLNAVDSLTLLNCLTIPVFKAVTQCTLLELSIFEVISDCRLALFLRLRVTVVGRHVDSEVCNAPNRFLPSESLLRVVDLRLVRSHVAARRAHFKMLFLVKHSFLVFSVFLWGRYFLGGEKSALGL